MLSGKGLRGSQDEQTQQNDMVQALMLLELFQLQSDEHGQHHTPSLCCLRVTATVGAQRAKLLLTAILDVQQVLAHLLLPVL
jgi:hypothetical protein